MEERKKENEDDEGRFSPFSGSLLQFRAISLLLYDGATPDSRFKCLLTYKIHHQAKYQRLNANTLYVAAIFFTRASLIMQPQRLCTSEFQ